MNIERSRSSKEWPKDSEAANILKAKAFSPDVIHVYDDSHLNANESSSFDEAISMSPTASPYFDSGLEDGINEVKETFPTDTRRDEVAFQALFLLLQRPWSEQVSMQALQLVSF